MASQLCNRRWSDSPRRTLLRRSVCIAALAILLLSTSARTAEAHRGAWNPGDPWWTAWNGDPLVLLNLAVLAVLYSIGVRRLWQKAGLGRGVACWQAAAFGGGLLALLAALVSPLDPLGEELSWVHMVQHMTLMMIAAPLFVLGSPGFVLLWGLPQAWRAPIGRWLAQGRGWRMLSQASWNPFAVWFVYALILWIWHVPVLYQAALRDPILHDIEHLTFFAAALLFWRIIIDPLSRSRLDYGLGVVFLFTTSLHSMALGVFMTLASQPWYPDYEGTAPLWDFAPLEDQQLAGLIMWVPACTIHTLAAAVLFGLWLRELSNRA